MIGALFILIVVPVLLAFWSFRLRRRGSRLWWIPAVLAALLFLSGLASRALQANQQAQELAGITEVDPETAFPEGLPYRFESIADREITAEMERVIRREAPFARVAARLIVHERAPIGLALAITAPRDAFIGDEFMSGFARGISERSGRDPARGSLAGRATLEFEVPSSGPTAYGMVWHRPGTNLVMFVMTVAEPDLRPLATAMIRRED